MIEIVKDNQPGVIQQIIELEKQAFGSGGMNEWHLVPLIRHGRVFIIKDEDIVKGSVQYLLDWSCPQKAYMFGVAVSDGYRGKGIGTKLLVESFKALAQENIEEIELTVDPENAAAVKVYQEKLGFEITGFRKNEYGDGEDRLVMLLKFKDYVDEAARKMYN